MSKRKGHRKKRRRRSPKNTRARLAAVAAALNRCEDAGMHMRTGAGAVFAHEGVILRLRGGKWEARMFAGKGDIPRPDPDDMDT